MDTLHSIENLPSEISEDHDRGSTFFSNASKASTAMVKFKALSTHIVSGGGMNFRFMARNIAVDWRQVSLIDIDRIARDMDIAALQQHIELVTFAKLDSLYDIDPLFVKLFQIAQYTLEYLLHSQVRFLDLMVIFICLKKDFLKNSICEEQKKVEKEKKKYLATMKEVAYLKEQITSLKKTNKQRRQMSKIRRFVLLLTLL